MELIYVQLDQLPQNFPLELDIPLPYIYRKESELDWNGIVDGILYVALYQPQHEHRTRYRDFLLAMEPELPHILQDRLRNQSEQRLWALARDTVNILLFLFPEENWPLLELCYLYEQEAEEAALEQRFAACRDSWNLAALGYQQMPDMDAKCYFQLAYYYLQCWNYPAARQAFISCQQLALSPEHPLWGQCHNWLRQLPLFEKESSIPWGGILKELHCALDATKHSEDIELHRSLWRAPLSGLSEWLGEEPDCGFLWYLRGFCLLYSHDAIGASPAFAKARELGWSGPLAWQVPYYLGVSHYLAGSYHEAARYLLEVLRRDTGHCAALYWLEKIYSDLEDWRSLSYRNLLQSLKPDFPDLLQNFV